MGLLVSKGHLASYQSTNFDKPQPSRTRLHLMNSQTPSSSKDQWAVLAFSRFILAACVLITHTGIVAPNYFVNRFLGQTGYPAVFGFFMISGYSIAASLAKTPEGYFIRRVRRIYPTYLCALALSIAVLIPGPLHLPLGQVLFLDNWKTILSNVFMLQGVLSESIISNGAVWSLSVEWWCYMLGILLIRINARWTALLIAISFSCLMLYIRKHGYLFGTADMPILGIPVITLAWAWLTGFLFFRRRTVATFSAMLLLPLMMFEVGSTLHLASIVIATSAIVVYFAKDIRISSPAVKKSMQWLGDMSYPLYLFHPPLLFVLSAFAISRNANVIFLMIVGIVAVGYFAGCQLMNLLASFVGMRRSALYTPSASSLTSENGDQAAKNA